MPRDVVLALDGYVLRMRRRDSRRIVERARARRGHAQRAPALRRRPRARPLPARVPACAGARTAPTGRLDADAQSSSRRPLGGHRRRPAVAAALARGEAAPPEWEDELTDRLRRQPEVRAALERMWPVLSGAELVHDLFGFEALVRSASGGVLTADEQRLLLPRAVADVARRRVDRGRPRAGRRSRRAARPAERGAAALGAAAAAATTTLEMARRTVDELGVGGFTNAADRCRALRRRRAGAVGRRRRRAPHLRARARRRGAGPHRRCSGACSPVGARRAR